MTSIVVVDIRFVVTSAVGRAKNVHYENLPMQYTEIVFSCKK